MCSYFDSAKYVVLFFVIVHLSAPEPHCSKFHYEEKLLEKMIRLEIAVENMKREMDETREQITTTLDNLQTERNKWETTLLDFKDKSVVALNSAVQETKTQLEEELKVLTAEKERWNKELKESVRMPEIVLFSARSPKTYSLTTGQTMVFTNIILNKGEAYDKETGVFTVPFAGVYTFSVQFCVYPGKSFDFAFMVNDKPFKISRIQTHPTSYISCYNTDAMTIADKNDIVKIKVLHSRSGTILQESNSYFWNIFSGHFVHAI